MVEQDRSLHHTQGLLSRTRSEIAVQTSKPTFKRRFISEAPGFRAEFFSQKKKQVQTNRSRCLWVTFTERANRDLEGLGFGGKFLLDEGFDVVAVKDSQDSWFQEEALARCFEFIDSVAHRYDRIVTYGSSMGGMAAIRYAGKVRARRAIAVSPIVKLDLEGDQRWQQDIDRLGGTAEVSTQDLDPDTRYVVAYDPEHRPDTLQIDYLKSIARYGIIEHPVRFGDHPVGYLLSSAGVLKEWVLDAALGDMEAPRLSRRAYRDSFTYCLSKATDLCALGRHNRALIYLARARALKLEHPEAARQLALRLHALGQHHLAGEVAREAIALEPTHLVFRNFAIASGYIAAPITSATDDATS